MRRRIQFHQRRLFAAGEVRLPEPEHEFEQLGGIGRWGRGVHDSADQLAL